jgi:hypothetical protein
MADTYTALLRFIMQTDAANINQWGSIFNSAVTELAEEAIAGKFFAEVTSGDVTLSTQNGLTDGGRNMFIDVIGNPGQPRTITVPTLNKLFVFQNDTNPPEDIMVQTALSDPITITAAQSPTIVFVDASNDSVHALGTAVGLIPAGDWISMPLFEETVGTLVTTAEYSVQGAFTMLYIPSFSHTFTGLLLALRAVSGVGSLPAAVKWTLPITAGFTSHIIDNGVLVPSNMILDTANERIEWQDSDPSAVLYNLNGTRGLNYNAIFNYSVSS